jgi:hypothetical protein
MALPFTDQVSATTTALLESTSDDNVYGSASLLYHLKESGQVVADGGDFIQRPIIYQKIAAGGSYTGADILNTNPTDTDTAAKADWKSYYVHAVITKTDMLRNSGDNAKVSLIESKTKNAQLKMGDLISTDIFSTNADSATGITGLRNAASASTTHHYIPVANFSGWIADVDSTTSALSMSAMEQQFLDASVGGDWPTICVTTARVFKKYWALMQNIQRVGEVSTTNGGFKYLLFNGIPVFHDSHCPGTASTANNHMFFLNTRHLFLYVNEKDNFSVEKLPPPSTQAITIQRLGWTGNLVVTNRRMISAFTVMNY